MLINHRWFAGNLAMMSTLCIVFTGLADFLFYDQPIGWTLGLFAFLWASAVTFKRPGKATWACWLATLGLSLSLAIEPSAWNIWMTLLTLITLAITAKHGMTTRINLWMLRWFQSLFCPLIVPIQDLNVIRRWAKRHPGGAAGQIKKLAIWIIPVILGSVFLLLFGIANPVIASWFEQAHAWLSIQLEMINEVRLFLWGMVLVGTWCLLRMRLINVTMNTPISQIATGNIQPPGVVETSMATPPMSPPTTPPADAFQKPFDWAQLDRILSPAVVLRCLIVFNLIFALQSVLDIRYLLYGAALPDGMSHSMYARRGAYPLVATALLAGLFVLVTFRDGGISEKLKTARLLVYFWIAQNMLLLASAAWRLSIYIEAYTLTRWRFAAGIWMGMVTIGFTLIILRIVTGRTNTWLRQANILLLIVVLYGCCFINFDGMIARYNVSQCREIKGKGVAIDLDYLTELGIESIPALRQLQAKSNDKDKANQARQLADHLSEHVDAQLSNWRGWTWQRAGLIDTQLSTSDTYRK